MNTGYILKICHIYFVFVMYILFIWSNRFATTLINVSLKTHEERERGRKEQEKSTRVVKRALYSMENNGE